MKLAGGATDLVIESSRCPDAEFWYPAKRIPEILDRNFQALKFLMHRTQYHFAKVRVLDEDTGRPIEAFVRVKELSDPACVRLRTDVRTGYANVPLDYGAYHLAISATGYRTARRKVTFRHGRPLDNEGVEVLLKRRSP